MGLFGALVDIIKSSRRKGVRIVMDRRPHIPEAAAIAMMHRDIAHRIGDAIMQEALSRRWIEHNYDMQYDRDEYRLDIVVMSYAELAALLDQDHPHIPTSAGPASDRWEYMKGVQDIMQQKATYAYSGPSLLRPAQKAPPKPVDPPLTAEQKKELDDRRKSILDGIGGTSPTKRIT